MEATTQQEKEFTCSLYPKVPQSRESVLGGWAKEQDKCLAELVEEGFEHDFDVSYGPQLVDIWYPKKKPTSEKVHVFTHGGYWLEFTKRSYVSIARCLLNAGYIVVMVEYTYASIIPLNEVVNQVEKAILFASERFPKAELTICGHSAGGHLTAKALENPKIQEKVKAAVIMTAVYEVLPLMGTSVAREIKLTEKLGKEMDLDPVKLSKFAGRIFVVSVDYDCPRLKQQSIDFVDKLSKLKKIENQTFDEDHFTIALEMHNINSKISKAFVEFLRESVPNGH
ncbi:Abhydrolase-3 domain-containing protein [Aphelenchoides bicaudatus]|nr:Abhydrolase-3 domain-containing protein [Aphelenchoides bicaudatus]